MKKNLQTSHPMPYWWLVNGWLISWPSKRHQKVRHYLPLQGCDNKMWLTIPVATFKKKTHSVATAPTTILIIEMIPLNRYIYRLIFHLHVAEKTWFQMSEKQSASRTVSRTCRGKRQLREQALETAIAWCGIKAPGCCLAPSSTIINIITRAHDI